MGTRRSSYWSSSNLRQRLFDHAQTRVASLARPVERVMAPGLLPQGCHNWCTASDSGLTVTRPPFTTGMQTDGSALELTKQEETYPSYSDDQLEHGCLSQGADR